ncbi:hypothetical protein [Candidatus Nitrosocosmicus franklandus]|uniref:Uncharacterized protein n=1 Tax=Candidatus Nitrosocosmicus franklandianus TaxID=1798806 RepID=A0A484I931_9ARCH|nr:hypothetical protein [Candidatus Nitrosocosmicus franklandus]VFJ14271.1 exported protein of unknown function [Candidatus Nitrosocosmicus franklandus]
MVIVRNNVTFSTIIMITLLLAGFQSLVFAQNPDSNSINSRIEEAQERMGQSLDYAQQKIAEMDDIQGFMNLDITEILEWFNDIIPFPGGGITGQ